MIFLSRLSGIPRQAKNFLRVYGEIFRRGWRRHPWLIIWTVVFDMMAVVSSVMVVVFLSRLPALYGVSRQKGVSAKARANQEPESTFGAIGDAFTSGDGALANFLSSLTIQGITVLILAGCFLALIGTIVGRYFATFFARRAARDLQKSEYFSSLKLLIPEGVSSLPSQDRSQIEYAKFLGQHMIHASKAYESVLRMAPSMIALPVALLGAFWLQPFVTAALILFSIIMLPIVAMVGALIHGVADAYYSEGPRLHRPAMMKHLRESTTLQTLSDSGGDESNQFDPLGPLRERYYTYQNQHENVLLAPARMQAATGVYRAIMFVIALGLMIFISLENLNLTAFALYAAALLVLLAQGQALISFQSNLNVYFPQVKRLLNTQRSLRERKLEDGFRDVVDRSGELGLIGQNPITVIDWITPRSYTTIDAISLVTSLQKKLADSQDAIDPLFPATDNKKIALSRLNIFRIEKEWRDKTGFSLVSLGDVFGVDADLSPEALGALQSGEKKAEGSTLSELLLIELVAVAHLRGKKWIELAPRQLSEVGNIDQNKAGDLGIQVNIVRRVKPNYSDEHAPIIAAIDETLVDPAFHLWTRGEEPAVVVVSESSEDGGAAEEEALLLDM